MARAAIPDVVFDKIDHYVDSLAPQIQPQIVQEIDIFQTKTIDSLDDKIVDAFHSLFDKKGSSGSQRDRGLNEDAPDSYGGQSLPFAHELASIARSFDHLADEATDDIQDIFNLTEGHSGGGQRDIEERSRGAGQNDSFKSFLSAAVDAIQEHSRNDSGGSGGGQHHAFDGVLGVISEQVKEATRNPEEKARLISPEIKEKVGAVLRQQHAPLAEQFTKIALDHIKKWLRGNTSTRDLGDGFKGELTDMVSNFAGLFGKKQHHEEGSSRAVGESDGGIEEAHGFSGVISKKLSTGLAKVHREVRLEFRKILGAIEKTLFELLPDHFQGPLEKLFGGNPFDESLGSSGSRGIGDDIKDKLLSKIRNLIRKVQTTLRESVLSIVNGGHRKFERQSWLFVQEKVESKVRKFLPDVRITVPDDIGNEGVDVGKPQESTMIHHSQQQASSSQQQSQAYNPPPDQYHSQSHQSHGGEASHFYNSSEHGQYQQHSSAAPPYQQPHDQFGYSGGGQQQVYQGGPPPQQPPYGQHQPSHSQYQDPRY